jgi:hypothetical protein
VEGNGGVARFVALQEWPRKCQDTITTVESEASKSTPSISGWWRDSASAMKSPASFVIAASSDQPFGDRGVQLGTGRDGHRSLSC